MKKVVCIALCILILLCLGGCSSQKVKLEGVPSFYYLRANLTYGEAGGVIGSEQVLTAGTSTDPGYLLALYLAGPTDDQLRSPYPSGTKLVDFRQEGNTLVLTMNVGFSKLTGMALTQACACLAMTAFEITDAEIVSIQAENAALDNAKSVNITRDSLVLQENAPKSP